MTVLATIIASGVFPDAVTSAYSLVLVIIIGLTILTAIIITVILHLVQKKELDNLSKLPMKKGKATERLKNKPIE